MYFFWVHKSKLSQKHHIKSQIDEIYRLVYELTYFEEKFFSRIFSSKSLVEKYKKVNSLQNMKIYKPIDISHRVITKYDVFDLI